MRLVLLFVVVFSLAPGARLAAHDIPSAYPVTGFFAKAEGEAELLLRVPLGMLLNVNLPKRGPGYIDLARLGDAQARAERAVADAFRLRIDGAEVPPALLRGRISRPSSDAFETYGAARAAIDGPPLAAERNVFWNQGYFDVRVVYPLTGDEPDFALVPELPPGLGERTEIELTVLAAGEAPRTLHLSGSGGPAPLNPDALAVLGHFPAKGAETLFAALPQIAFLICLALPLGLDRGRLIAVSAAFALGATTTLTPTAFGVGQETRWLAPAVEAAAAFSILFVAVANVLGRGVRLRSALAYGFGLVHGVVLGAPLQPALQLAGPHTTLALAAYISGVALCGLLVILVAAAAPAVLRGPAEVRRVVILAISVMAAHQAWLWMTDGLARAALAPVFALGLPAAAWALIGLAATLASIAAAWRLSRPEEGAANGASSPLEGERPGAATLRFTRRGETR